MKKLLTILCVLAVVGCTSVRDLKDQTVLYWQMGVEHKMLIPIQVPCAATHPDKPAFLWVVSRPSTAEKMAIVCDEQCNCKIINRTAGMKIQPIPTEDGICH